MTRKREGSTRMQTKDIADDAVLAVIDDVRAREGRWTLTYDIEAALPDVPHKVIVAKMRSMLRRGLVTGCGCGCRGDFQRAEASS